MNLSTCEDPVKKMIEIKERSETGIQRLLDHISELEYLEDKGKLTIEDTQPIINRNNRTIKSYEENIQLIDVFFEKYPQKN